jgi:hypothetical protein
MAERSPFERSAHKTSYPKKGAWRWLRRRAREGLLGRIPRLLVRRVFLLVRRVFLLVDSQDPRCAPHLNAI